MIDQIVLLFRRLCLCGFLTAAVMALAKETGQKEILRLCCVCLTIVMLFRSFPMIRAGGNEIYFKTEKTETANLIEESVQQAKEDQRLAMQQQAEDYLQTQCRAVCKEVLVKVKATLSEDQVFTIEQVEIFHGEAQKGRLMQTLTQNGISEERILFH